MPHILFADISQVARHVHRLVVADDNVHIAARRPCLVLETHQQVHCIARTRTAVQDIADDHEPVGTARPRQVGIENSDVLQRGHHRRVSPVHVGDGDDAPGVFDIPVVCPRAGSSRQDKNEQKVRNDSRQVVFLIRLRKPSLVSMLDFDHRSGE